MRFNRKQYDEIVLTLENEAKFRSDYIHSDTTYVFRRQIIANWLGCPGYPPKTGLPAWSKNHDIVDRDQIRRYFDDRYHLPVNEINKYAPIPSVWDTVKITQIHDETIVEFKFTGTQAQADEQLAMHRHAAKQINQLCGIPTPTPEETVMNKPITITTKTFVGETDISALADSTIYTMIANEEAAIKELSAIENKPKRLVTEIEKRQAGILALVAHLDAKV